MEAYRDLVRLERQLDACLERPYVTAAAEREVARAAERWSRAVWATAEAAGASPISAADRAYGLQLADRVVFICGVHRSGTTLVRDLLDGHPALAVLPSEGSYFTQLERRLRRVSRGARLPYLGAEWIRRLANPIHREPYWLLGRSSLQQSRYVDFARSLQAWWPLVEAAIGRAAMSWPLAAIALAYAQCTGGLAEGSRPEYWVEKTPTNERFLPRLRAEFPRARVIHVVRHPFAVYASREQERRNAGRRFTDARRVLADLARSYRIALEQSGQRRRDYLLIRYEDLTGSPRETIGRIAGFLEIESVGPLLHPTAAGIPTAPNSSFPSDAPPGRICRPDHGRRADSLTPADRARIVSAVGQSARSLGFELPAPFTRCRPTHWLFGTRET